MGPNPYLPARDDSAGRNVWGGVEAALLIGALILFSEGFLPRLVSAEESADGSPILRLIWLPIYALTIGLILLRFRGSIRGIVKSPFLLALAGLAIASTVWSIDPGITQRRGIAILMTTLFGVYLASRYSWMDGLRLFGWVWLFLAIVTLVSSAAFPGFGTMTEIHVGAWRGLWWEKNAMGGHMARAALLFGWLLLFDGRARRVWGFALVVSLLLVVMSTSKTSLLGTGLGLGALAWVYWMTRGAPTAITLAWVMMSGLGIAVSALLLAPDQVFALLGRDATLTGRTDIWEALVVAIADRPVLGYGFGAFWQLESEPAYWVRETVDWLAPTAHNGWLEVLLAVGFAGFAIFCADFLRVMTGALRMIAASRGALFAICFLLQFLLFSLSESIVMKQNAIIWVMYCFVSTRIAIEMGAWSLRPRARTGRPVGFAQTRRAVKVDTYPPK